LIGEWREKNKRVRLSVGKDAQEAAARRQRKQAELNAVESGVSVMPENGNGQRSVAAAVGCNPKLDFLDCLKAIAERAKVDKNDFRLHKFRATFATRCQKER
jgi:hypothetical protein